MRHYSLMYVGWIAGVITMAAVAVAWYRHVEAIGLRALADRMTEDHATGATEATETSA